MNHHTLFLLLLVAAASCSKSFQTPTGTDSGKDKLEKFTVSIDGENRTFWVFEPDRDNTNELIPMVIMYHGALGSGVAFSESTRFDRVAEQNDVLVVYPDALVGKAVIATMQIA